MFRSVLSNLLMVAGGGLLLVSLIDQSQILQFIARQQITTTVTDQPATVSGFLTQQRTALQQPTHLSIAGYVDTALTSESYNEGVWSVSATSSSHLLSSAYPGENGNIIVYGHNRPSILGNLTSLKGPEIITVTTADGSQHHYKITERVQVTLNQTEYLRNTASETLTIYTCAGPFDRYRFVVRAVPVAKEAVKGAEKSPPPEFSYQNPFQPFIEHVTATTYQPPAQP